MKNKRNNITNQHNLIQNAIKRFQSNTMKNTTKYTTNQVKEQKKSRRLNGWEKSVIFLPENSTIPNLQKEFSENSIRQNNLFNLLVWYCDKFKTVYLSQAKFAQQTNYSRRTVSRLFKAWTEMGYMDKYYRHRNSSFYRLSPLFYNPHVRIALQDYIPAFKKLSVLFLLLAAFWSNSDCNSDTSEKQLQHGVIEENSTPYRNVLGTYIYNLNLFHKKTGAKSDFFDLRPVEYPIQVAKKKYHLKKVEDLVMVVPDYIKKISCLRLSTAGMLSLARFPEEAVAYAQDRLFNYPNKIDDPFRLFYSMATNYCTGKRLTINHAMSLELLRLFGIPEGAILQTPLEREEFLEEKDNWNRNKQQEGRKIKHSSSYPFLATNKVSQPYRNKQLASRKESTSMVVSQPPIKEWRATTEEECNHWRQTIENAQNEAGMLWLKAMGINPPEPPLFVVCGEV